MQPQISSSWRPAPRQRRAPHGSFASLPRGSRHRPLLGSSQPLRAGTPCYPSAPLPLEARQAPFWGRRPWSRGGPARCARCCRRPRARCHPWTVRKLRMCEERRKDRKNFVSVAVATSGANQPHQSQTVPDLQRVCVRGCGAITSVATLQAIEDRSNFNRLDWRLLLSAFVLTLVHLGKDILAQAAFGAGHACRVGCRANEVLPVGEPLLPLPLSLGFVLLVDFHTSDPLPSAKFQIGLLPPPPPEIVPLFSCGASLSAHSYWPDARSCPL